MSKNISSPDLHVLEIELKVLEQLTKILDVSEIGSNVHKIANEVATELIDDINKKFWSEPNENK